MSGDVGTMKLATFTFSGDKYWYRTIGNYFESTFTAPSDAYVGFIQKQRLVGSDESILDSVCNMYRLQLYKGSVLVKETEPQGFGDSDGVTVMYWSSLFTDGFYLLPGETYTIRQIAAGTIRTSTKTVYITETLPSTKDRNISCFYV